jgi:hypothetical protein
MLAAAFLPSALGAYPEFRGRLDLDFSGTDFRGVTERQFNQNLELSVTDALFVKNVLTLTYFLERLTADNQLDDIVHQRWRASLAGRHYSFTGEVSPRYTLRGTTDENPQSGEGRRFNLVISPPAWPVTSVTVDRNERTGGGTGTNRVDVVNEDRLVHTTWAHRFLNARALYRERNADNRLDTGGDRRVRDINWGVGARVPLPRRMSLTTDYDFLLSRDRGDTEFEGETLVNNVSTRATVRPLGWVTGFASFLGNYIRKDGGVQRSSLSEIVSGLRVTPVGFLRISGSRDYRRIREEGTVSISDFFRAEVVAEGRIRERMEGRATLTRTFVLTSRDGSFPSQGYLFSLNSRLYPGITLTSDFNITQSANPEQASGRFQVRRIIDLRTIPASRVMFDLNVQTFSSGDDFPWLGTQILTLGADLNYQPARRMTLIFSIAREDDRRAGGRRDYLFTGSANYLFPGGSTLSVLYNRRGDGSDGEQPDSGAGATTSFSGAQEGVLVQLNLKLRDRANLRLSFDTRTIPGDERLRTVGANFVKWF